MDRALSVFFSWRGPVDRTLLHLAYCVWSTTLVCRIRWTVGRDPWLVEIDLLKVAAEELCVVCVRVENCKTELDLANFEAELSGATAVLSGYGEDNASVRDLFMKLAVGVSRRRLRKRLFASTPFFR